MGDAGFTFLTPPSSTLGTPTLRSPSIATSFRSRRSQASSTHSSYTNRSDKTLRDLVGNWMLNTSLSTLTKLQANGVASPSNIIITQSHYPSQIFIKSFPMDESYVTERWFPPQKLGQWSSWNTNIEGARSRCRWVRGDQFEHKDGIAFLTYGLTRLGEFLEAEIVGKGGEWRMGQVWFVQTLQRGSQLVRRFVRCGENEERSEGEEVWEFVGR